MTEKGLKLCIHGSPNIHSLMKKEGCPLQPPDIIYFCKFIPKRTWNYVYLACKIQNFLAYAYLVCKILLPLWNPQMIYFCKFRPKWEWNYAYLAYKIQNFLRQGGPALLQPPRLYIHIKKGCPLLTTRNHIFL